MEHLTKRMLIPLLKMGAFACLLLATGIAKPPDAIYLSPDSLPKYEREALLILPGFGDSGKRRKIQLAYFAEKGYDVFIPSYRDRKSYAETVENLAAFIEEYDLGEYKSVHVFSYILGSWVLNDYLNAHPLPNLGRIVYDRSPLQERAPMVVAHRLKILGRIKVGRMVEEFSEIPYPPLYAQRPEVGLIVECKATLLIRLFKRYAMSFGPLCWEESCFNQKHSDIHYTWLHHDQMYTRMDIIGPQVLHFIRDGSFCEDSQKAPFQWDYFSKLKKQPAL